MIGLRDMRRVIKKQWFTQNTLLNALIGWKVVTSGHHFSTRGDNKMTIQECEEMISEEMTLKDRARFISHATATLTDELYYTKDKVGLEVLIKNLELILGHARDCLDCVELMSRGGDVFKKIKLMLEYLALTDLNEEFVGQLEMLATQVHEDWAQSTEAAISEFEEAEMVKRLKGLIKKHELEELPSLSA